MRFQIKASHDNTQVQYKVYQLKPGCTRKWTQFGKPEDDGSRTLWSSSDYQLSYSGELAVFEGKDVLESVYNLIEGTLALSGAEALSGKGVQVESDHARSFLVGDVISIAADGFGWQKFRVAILGFVNINDAGL